MFSLRQINCSLQGTGRWKKPQPVPAWGDVFVTRNDGTMGTSCIQTRTGTRANYNNSEDCLTLNVYTRAPGMTFLYSSSQCTTQPTFIDQ